MANKNEKQEMAELRSFLIKNFLMILAVVIVVEYAIFQLVNVMFLPIFRTVFVGKMDWDTNISLPHLLILFAILALELVLFSVNAVLPSAAQGITRSAVEWIEAQSEKAMPNLSGIYTTGLDGTERLFLFACLLAIVVLLLIPFAIGAAWYARITTKKVHELQEKRDAMREEYNRKRNQMLSDIAHDLRTPITTVSGYAKALSDGMVTDPEKVKEYLTAMQVKSARMNDLIQLLFEYVKLDSEGFALDCKETNLAELLRENAALMYPDVEDAKMEFEIDIPEEVFLKQVDNIQFSRVITNLITNAIRHNKAGDKIGLILKTCKEGAQIVVADTGEKIPPALAEHLFEPFVMGDASRNSKGGSGLGMSIAHKVVEMHGWELIYSEQISGFSKGFIISIR